MKPCVRLLALTVLTLSTAAFAADLSRENVKKLLDSNPDLVLDVLRQNKTAFFDIVQQASQEEQVRQQKEAEEAALKEVETSLKNPIVASITEKSHVRGSRKAKYTIVTYSDFECPYCSRGNSTLEALRQKYGDKLRVVFKNKPLPMHAQAMPAAQLFVAAFLQSPDKAWALHDKFFQDQDQLGEAFFKETAKTLGLDVDKLMKDAQTQAVKDSITADMEEADKLGFQGTPGFLLNGVPIRGAYPIEHFENIIAKIDAMKK